MPREPRGVIVEGPDCSGKTTLIKGIKALLSGGGWDGLQMGHRPGDQFTRYLRVYLEANRLLLDRSHFSEVIYGDLWRSGRHFAPWERGVLDRIARRDFVTVLCTSPAHVLCDRYMSRPLAQLPMSRDEITAVHTRFAEIVGAHAAFVFDTHPLESFSFPNAASQVVDHLHAGGLARTAGTGADMGPHRPRFIVLEGASARDRSRIAQLLATNLSCWNVTTLHRGPERDAFSPLMQTYLAADRTIIEGGHVSRVIERGLSSADGLSADDLMCLCHYVASRGVVIVCEGVSPGARAEAMPFHDILRRANATYYSVRADDTDSVSDVITAIAIRTGEVRESSRAVPRRPMTKVTSGRSCHNVSQEEPP